MKEALKTILALGWWVSVLILCGVSEADLSFGETILYGGLCLAAFWGCGKGLEYLLEQEEESNNVNAE